MKQIVKLPFGIRLDKSKVDSDAPGNLPDAGGSCSEEEGEKVAKARAREFLEECMTGSESDSEVARVGHSGALALAPMRLPLFPRAALGSDRNQGHHVTLVFSGVGGVGWWGEVLGVALGKLSLQPLQSPGPLGPAALVVAIALFRREGGLA